MVGHRPFGGSLIGIDYHYCKPFVLFFMFMF